MSEFFPGSIFFCELFQMPVRAACRALFLMLLSGLISAMPVVAEKKEAAENCFFFEFAASPFPYDGEYADSGRPFFDSNCVKTGEPAHTNRYGEKIPLRRYQNNKVLFWLPEKFNPHRPFFYLVFFHSLPSDPLTEFSRLKLVEQLGGSGKNLILIMPPLADNAADASPGKFFRADNFRNFIEEADAKLVGIFSDLSPDHFSRIPVVLAAFSGGYKSVAYAVDRGGLGRRLIGAVLFDAMFEDADKFARWITSDYLSIFFLHLFGSGSCEKNSHFVMAELESKKIRFSQSWPQKLSGGDLHFVKVATGHNLIPIAGPPQNPLSVAIKAVQGYNISGEVKNEK